jgi:methionyl aminopeptidase
MHEKEYREAGRLSRRALEKGAKMVKPGAKLLDVAEAVEKFVLDSDAKISFPCNISVNNQAAHFTPSADDKAVFRDSDVVKLDVGARVDGFIGDTAMTIDLSGENGKLLEASEQALADAISIIKPGVTTNDIGVVAANAIESRGFKVISNLCGHRIEEYDLHSGVSVPNVPHAGAKKLEEGWVVAIEPFATLGRGRVTEDARVDIFDLQAVKPVRLAEARRIIEFADEHFDGLPFAERWLKPVAGGFALRAALRELVNREVLHQYPGLVENGLVSQAEKTVMVTKDGCEVLTE